METPRLIILLLIWVICGLLAYLIDFYRPKYPDEEMPHVKFYVAWGVIMLLCIMFTHDAPTIDDDDL